MVLSVKSEKADRLARELAALTGESITEVVESSLSTRLDLERAQRQTSDLSDIVERFGALEVLDDRVPDEIIGYDATGLPR